MVSTATEYPKDQQHLMELGWQAWRDGDWFAAHDHWEEVWMSLKGRPRRLLQALIQLSVALVHLEQGNLKGARSLLIKAQDRLRQVGDTDDLELPAAALPEPSALLAAILDLEGQLGGLPDLPDKDWGRIQPPELTAATPS
jgi:FAD/FMN-containing dehydrogenase